MVDDRSASSLYASGEQTNTAQRKARALNEQVFGKRQVLEQVGKDLQYVRERFGFPSSFFTIVW